MARAKPTPDLTLLDVIMPGIDGYEVCAHLKADLATRDIPLLGRLVVQSQVKSLAALGNISRRSEEMRVTIRTYLLTKEAEEQAAAEATLLAEKTSRRNLLVAIGISRVLFGILGVLTFRRIVLPIRALQTSVESIAEGNYQRQFPFMQADDETGALARSIEVLQRGAAAMENQRW